MVTPASGTNPEPSKPDGAPTGARADAHKATSGRAAQAVRTDRAMGAFLGGAIGDAMGMPAQTLDRHEIRTRYGVIDDFVAPFDGHPVSHGLDAAQVTDDTEQTLLLAALLLRNPDRFDDAGWAHALLEWEAGVAARGLHDLLGPSSKRALEALAAGASAAEAGRWGTTNGAAMRISPVAIATPVEPLGAFLDAVEAACRVTHNTAEAIAAAAAVAAVISAGVDGAQLAQAMAPARAAAREGALRGCARGVRDIAERIDAALALAATRPSPEAFAEVVGTGVASHEAVPAAFGLLALAGGDAWQAARLAANLGGDTDTIGAIAAGMGGACAGAAALPPAAVARVVRVNGLDLGPMVAGLLSLRSARQRVVEAQA